MKLAGIKPSKFYLFNYIKKRLESSSGELACLDMGCGTAELFLPLVKQFPHFHYTGIEPYKPSFVKAVKNYFGLPNTELYFGTAYANNPQASELNSKFDIVVSLSVLEHIKDVESFLRLSVNCAKPSGEIVHLYDLGHSLYPSGIKERIQVALCNSPLRKFVPENKIARYVDFKMVLTLMQKFLAKHEKTTFHNMPGHVSLLKKLGTEVTESLLCEISEKEMEWSNLLPDAQIKVKEKLFPTVAIWTRKE